MPRRPWIDDDGELFQLLQPPPGTTSSAQDVALPALSIAPAFPSLSLSAGAVGVTLPALAITPAFPGLIITATGGPTQTIVLPGLAIAPVFPAPIIERGVPGASSATIPDLIHVQVFSPFPTLGPLDDLLLNPSVTAISVETQLPGGFAQLTVGRSVAVRDPVDGHVEYVRRFLPEPVAVVDMAHVVVSMGALTLFEGIVTSVGPDATQFTAQGYGTWALRWSQVTTGGTTRVTSGVIARAAIGVNPWLVVGEVTDAGVRHAWDEMQDRTSADIISALSTEGGRASANDPVTPWMFTVYEGRLARFVAQVAPSGPPRWSFSYDPERMQLGWDYADRIDAARTVYQDADGVRRVTAWHYRPGVDRASLYLRREQLTGGASPDTAVAIAQAEVARRGVGSLAGSVMVPEYAALAMRAGDSMHIEGYGDGIVLHTAQDLYTGELTAQLGDPSRSSFAGFLQRLDRLERADAQGRDRTTGARILKRRA